ncbi:MAG: ferrous iron transport protein A [Coriobacteriales bacterium]|jgi:ferrous iron transport protein A|nr:ferrous iron transport protein A [Coriobacteriales bacterium]
MTLGSAQVGSTRRIIGCNAQHQLRCKLETMGLVPGEQVQIISSSDSGFIIEVKHSRLAISCDMADCLIVS